MVRLSDPSVRRQGSRSVITFWSLPPVWSNRPFFSFFFLRYRTLMRRKYLGGGFGFLDIPNIYFFCR